MDVDPEVKTQYYNSSKLDASEASTIELTEEEQVFQYQGKEETTIFIVIPPDGGWGWIVVTAAFYSFLVADGFISTFGVFIKDMAESLNCAKGQIVLVGGITTAFFCISAPFTSALINRFGYRKIGMLGSVVATISCLLSADATTLRIVYLTHGVLCGIGLGMIYLPAVIAVGFYFERWRALATGVAVCGAGMGGIILPLALTVILNESGWRYTYKIMGILCMLSALCGYLFKPLKPTKIHVEAEDDGVSITTQESCKNFFNKFHNNAHPTLYEVHSKSRSVVVDPSPYTFRNPRPAVTANSSNATISILHRKVEPSISSEFVVGRLSYCTTASGSSYKNIKMTKPESSTRPTQNQLETVQEETKSTWMCSNFFRRIFARLTCRAIRTCLSRSCQKLKYLFSKRTENNNTVVRPIYRDDIFYSGSLLILPEYQRYVNPSKSETTTAPAPARSGVEYTMAVTRTITQRELVEENKYVLCTEAVKRTLATMLDFNLLKSPSFVLLVINAVFTSLGYYTPYLFIRDRSVQHGVSSSVAFWLISCIGIANTIGRIVCGIVTTMYGVSAINLTFASLFIGGFATTLSCFSFQAWAQFMYATVYGFCIACTSALRTIIIVDLLGLEKLTNAIGILLMFQGFATLIGTATSGLLREVTGNYQLSFHFSGGCLVIASFLLIPMKKVSEWEKQKREN